MCRSASISVLLPYLFICSSICPLFQATVEDKVVCFVLVGIKLLVSVSVFVRWSRWSCRCCCSAGRRTCVPASSWSPSAARSPCRTPSPPASSAPPREEARSWASATLTWTTSRRTPSSTWVQRRTHVGWHHHSVTCCDSLLEMYYFLCSNISYLFVFLQYGNSGGPLVNLVSERKHANRLSFQSFLSKLHISYYMSGTSVWIDTNKNNSTNNKKTGQHSVLYLGARPKSQFLTNSRWKEVRIVIYKLHDKCWLYSVFLASLKGHSSIFSPLVWGAINECFGNKVSSHVMFVSFRGFKPI